MATEFWYNDGGTQRKMSQVWYNDGGTWRKAVQIWYNDGGTWRKVFSGVEVVLTDVIITASDASISPSDAAATAGIRLSANGGAYAYRVQGAGAVATYSLIADEWLRGSTTGSDYDVYTTVTSGSVPLGTLDTWISLGTDRTWSVRSERSTPGFDSNTSTLTIAIRPGGGGANLASATVTITSNASEEL